jgi:kynurenine formamidase
VATAMTKVSERTSMCPPGCLHTICQQATRRGLLKAGFGIGAGIAAGVSQFAAVPVAAATATTPSTPKSFSNVLDLTHTLYEGFPTYDGSKWFSIEPALTWAKDKLNINRWTLMEHTGTHMDAPLHFSENGMTVDQIPITDLVVPLVVINIAARAAGNPDATVTPDDITAWEAKNGPIPDAACVAMNSGWYKLLDSPKFTGADGAGKFHTPGFHAETAQLLMDERNVKGIGVDTLSLDPGIKLGEFPVHYAWLTSGRWGVECLANLDAVPEKGAWLVVGGPKVRGGTGGPSRILALV